MFGIDEAGKGPVLGPMVIGIVEVDSESALPDEVADSKRLTKTKRERLAEELIESPQVTTSTVHVSPEEIDDPDTDMNLLTVQAFSAAIDKLEPTGTGFLDASDTDAERFKNRVQEYASEQKELTAEHGADDEYPVVEAASIIAKVKRDELIERISSEYEQDIGSGYPSDSTTREFLHAYIQETGRLPDCARASWKTSKDMLSE